MVDLDLLFFQYEQHVQAIWQIQCLDRKIKLSGFHVTSGTPCITRKLDLSF